MQYKRKTTMQCKEHTGGYTTEELDDGQLGSIYGGFMPNFFKQGKDAFFQAMGGDSNPFVKGIKDMENMFGTDDWQQQFHDMIADGMEQASGEAKGQMEGWMQKFNEMAEQGASKSQFEGFAQEIKSKMAM